jgi:hypothetical protein
MVSRLTNRNFLQSKTITANDQNSFVDIILSTQKTYKVTTDTETGLSGSTVYTSVLSIGGVSRTVSVTGSSVTTIASLVTALNSRLTGLATAVFIEDESLIKIRTAASGNTAISVTTIGSLITELKGTKVIGITASYGTPCVGGGVNFIVTNTASSSNTIDCAFIADSRSSAGARVEVTTSYTNTTGVLQIKRASGRFSVGDVVTATTTTY